MARKTATRKTAAPVTPAVEPTDETPTTDAAPEADTPTDDANATVKGAEFALDVESALWVAANARPAQAPCLCGCGGLTKGRFVPGHDALLKRALAMTQVHGTADAAAAATAALETYGW